MIVSGTENICSAWSLGKQSENTFTVNINSFMGYQRARGSCKYRAPAAGLGQGGCSGSSSKLRLGKQMGVRLCNGIQQL